MFLLNLASLSMARPHPLMDRESFLPHDINGLESNPTTFPVPARGREGHGNSLFSSRDQERGDLRSRG